MWVGEARKFNLRKGFDDASFPFGDSISSWVVALCLWLGVAAMRNSARCGANDLQH